MAPLPVAIPSPSPLTEPYVSVNQFKAAPTWVDVNDLVESGTDPQQEAELYNVLLRASEWADSFCNMRLGAHTEYEQMRVRVDSRGFAYIHPSSIPVRSVVGLAFGSDFQNMTLLTDLTQIWVEDQQGIVVSMLPIRGAFFGNLEFGSIPAGDSYMYVAIQYVAGFVSTTLSATANVADTALHVNNAAGILAPPTTLLGPLPGSTLRVYDPGKEEAFQVGTSYDGVSLTVPVTPNVTYIHPVTAGPAGQVAVSEMPAAIHQAVIDMAVALLIRQDTSGSEPFAGESFGPAAKRAADKGVTAGLLDHAYELLEPYVRRR